MTLEADLADIVGSAHVLTDPDLTAAYGTDWTRRWSARPRCVVRPATTAAMSAVVRACAAHGVAVVPQGGNTGLVGGGVPRGDGTSGGALDATARRLDPVDTATTRAKVVAAPASRWPTSTRTPSVPGGAQRQPRRRATPPRRAAPVAANAGACGIVGSATPEHRYFSLEAVSPDGSVVSPARGPAKDDGGYDLGGLLVGGEGHAQRRGRECGCGSRPLPDHPPSVALGRPAKTSPRSVPLLRQPGLTAAELVLDAGMELVRRGRRAAGTDAAAVAGVPAAGDRRPPAAARRRRGRGRPGDVGLPRPSVRGGRDPRRPAQARRLSAGRRPARVRRRARPGARGARVAAHVRLRPRRRREPAHQRPRES